MFWCSAWNVWYAVRATCPLVGRLPKLRRNLGDGPAVLEVWMSGRPNLFINNPFSSQLFPAADSSLSALSTHTSFSPTSTLHTPDTFPTSTSPPSTCSPHPPGGTCPRNTTAGWNRRLLGSRRGWHMRQVEEAGGRVKKCNQ